MLAILFYISVGFFLGAISMMVLMCLCFVSGRWKEEDDKSQEAQLHEWREKHE